MVPPSIMSKNSKHRMATVVFPDGEVRRLGCQPAIAAAELMLECPNFFLANSQSLRVGRRFSALSADEELEVGNLYLMFPMKRVKSIVTVVDMAPLRLMGALSGSESISGGTGNDQHDMEFEEPAPTYGEAGLFPAVPDHKRRLSSCGSRKPLLETIREEPVWS